MKKYWEKFTDKFGNTILHPQFIMLSYTGKAIKEAQKYTKNKTIIDVGCGRMPYRKILEPIAKKYVGVDHPKISSLYNPDIKPEILADITKNIPVISSSFDIALFLEVLEYLENPEITFSEIKRILKPRGILIMTSPFLYSIHDKPFDRNRFTDTKIKNFLEKENFKIKKLTPYGGFLSFWFLSLNVFLFKRIMDILKTKKDILSLIYLCLLLLITPPIIIITNSIFILSENLNLFKYPNYFPLDYLVVAVKQ